MRTNWGAFTLIELLVVIVIIAVISAVALLSLGILGDDRSLQREARRLSSLIELANDEASIQGRDYGLEFMRSGYRFVEFDPLLNQWYEMIGDDFLRPRQIEEGLEFELIIEDRRILLDESAAETQRDEDDTNLTDDYIPHILIMSSGDVSPFELRFVRPNDGTAITLTMSLAGELEIQGDGQEPY
jgi:general secretion pathway protein H